MQSLTKKTILGLRLAFFALAGYWLLIFVLTHLPAKSLVTPDISDKLMHFLAYGGLGTMLCYSTSSKNVMKRFAMIAGVGILYAAVDEWTQGFVPGRYSDKWDFVADSVGILTAIGAYITVRFFVMRWKSRPRSTFTLES